MFINKTKFTILAVVLIFIGGSRIVAQDKCASLKMMTEKNCEGDQVNDAETDLYQIIVEYRRQNNLPTVTLSKSLSVLANRHLLDLENNLKKTTHSWSDCPFDLNDRATWKCVGDAPHRLKIDYAGQGFENLYRNLNGAAEPLAALEAWKKSDLHNSLILNLKFFADTKFDALGVAIRGQYISIWFGTKNANVDGTLKTSGLGVSYAEMIKNLDKVVTIEKSSSLDDEKIWNGFSKDKSVFLEVIGKEKEIDNARIALRIKLAGEMTVPPDKRKLISTFVENIFGSSERNDAWLDENLALLRNKNASFRSLVKNGKIIQISRDTQNRLVLIAEPYKNQKNKMPN